MPENSPAPDRQRRRGRLKNKNILAKTINEAWDRTVRRREVYTLIERAIRREPRSVSTPEDFSFGGIQQVDWGSLRADVNDEVTTKFSIATDTETFVSCKSDWREGTAESRAMMTDVAREHKAMLRRSASKDGYDLKEELRLEIFHSVAHGGGFLWNPDHPHTWHFRSVHPGDMLWTSGAGLNVDEWTFCGVRVWYPLHTLLEKIADAEAAAAMGWDMKEVELFLRNTTKLRVENVNTPGWHMSAYDDENNLNYQRPDTVRFSVCYIKEWDDTWTKIIAASDAGYTSAGYAADAIRVLYRQEEHCERLSHILHFLPHEVIFSAMSDLTGVGHQMLPYHDLENSFINLMIARILIASGLVIQAKDEATIEAFEDIVWGDFLTLLPPEFAGEQVGLQSNLGELQGLREMIDGLRRERSRTFGATPKIPEPVQTAAATQMLYASSSQLDAMSAGQFVSHLDRWWDIHFRALLGDLPEDACGRKTRDWMLSRLARMGVPLEALFGWRQIPDETADAWKNRLKQAKAVHKEGKFYQLGQDDKPGEEIQWPAEGIYEVGAAKLLGLGNQVSAQGALQALERNFPKMTAFGQEQFLRLRAAIVTRDWEFADLFHPRTQLDPIEEEEQQDAYVEGTVLAPILGQLRSIPVSSRDNHQQHMARHLNDAIQLLALIQQGQVEPQVGLQAIAALRAHAGYDGNGNGNGGHWAWLQGDDSLEDILAEINAGWNTVVNGERQIIAKMRQMAQQQQAAMAAEAAQGPQLSPKEQQDLERQRIKAEQDDEVHARKLQLMSEEHALKMQIMRDSKGGGEA